MVHNEASSSKAKPGKKGKKKINLLARTNDGEIRKDLKCHFCKKNGHFRKDCPKCKSWFEKKGMYHVSVCYESNLIEVPNNTWWLEVPLMFHTLLRDSFRFNP